jgi:hypothetical protein
VPFTKLQATLKQRGLMASIHSDEEELPEWDQAILRHANGREIAMIERNPVVDGALGGDELAEFVSEIEGCKPASAVNWLKSFFPRVKCIYTFQVLSGTEHKNGWEILGDVKNVIWSFAPAILQADHEGFSNEDGYHILWQFSDSVDGSWWMGVLDQGKWRHFQMDLGKKEHREAFFQGQVPAGISTA